MSDLGKYRLLERIAEGATAEVFRATRLSDKSKVVVKRLLPERASDSRFRRLFEEEAKILRTLDHPGIVRLLDINESGGQVFLVLEDVDGWDLATLLRDQATVTARLAAHLASRIASALAHVHARGLIHRDISPENILISTDGRVKLSDFGIAQTEDKSASTSAPKGKLGYVSPEQAAGKTSGKESDVFSLGAVLYTMLVGRPPTPDRAPTAFEVSDTQLINIVGRCLAENPSQRFASAVELETALLAHLEKQDDEVKPAEIASWARARIAANAPAQKIDLVARDLLGTSALDRSTNKDSTALIAVRTDLQATQLLPARPELIPPTIQRGVPIPIVLALIALTALITALITRSAMQ